jgi:hypothetical protein
LAAAFIIFIMASTALRVSRNATIDYEPAAQDEDLSTTAKILDTFTGNDNEMFDTLANLVSVYPERNGFKPWSLVTDIFIRAIPRVIVKEKPLESPDEFIVTLWPEHYRVSRGSAASSIFGSFYIYGGTAAVFMLSFLTGTFLKALWRWYCLNPKNINIILLYAFVPSITVVFLRGTVTDTLGRLFFTVLPMIGAIKYWGSLRVPAPTRKLRSR